MFNSNRSSYSHIPPILGVLEIIRTWLIIARNCRLQKSCQLGLAVQLKHLCNIIRMLEEMLGKQELKLLAGLS